MLEHLGLLSADEAGIGENKTNILHLNNIVQIGNDFAKDRISTVTNDLDLLQKAVDDATDAISVNSARVGRGFETIFERTETVEKYVQLINGVASVDKSTLVVRDLKSATSVQAGQAKFGTPLSKLNNTTHQTSRGATLLQSKAGNNLIFKTENAQRMSMDRFGIITMFNSSGKHTQFGTQSGNFIRSAVGKPTTFQTGTDLTNNVEIYGNEVFIKGLSVRGEILNLQHTVAEQEKLISTLTKKLTDLTTRVGGIENNFVDSRRTYKFRNRKTGKYIGTTGINTNSSSVDAHYGIERD